MYMGEANYALLKDFGKTLPIPLCVSGDIFTPEKAIGVMALLVLFITIPTTMYSSWISKKSGKYFINQQIALAKTNGYVEEMTNGQRVIKVFNYEDRAETAFDVVNDDLFEQSTKANRYANVLMPIVNQIGNLQYVILAMRSEREFCVDKNIIVENLLFKSSLRLPER